MSNREIIFARVIEVSAALGLESGRFTLVGGSAVAVHTDRRVDARETHDVDLVVHATTQTEAQQVERLLGKCGFHPDITSARQFIGAFYLGQIEVDVAMAPKGGTNAWYPTVLELSEVDSALGLRVATPLPGCDKDRGLQRSRCSRPVYVT